MKTNLSPELLLRAEGLLKAHEAKYKFRPHQLQAQALHLLYKSLPKDCQPPKPVERLLVAALGLPSDYKPGQPWERLDKRGKPRHDARDMAVALALQFHEEHGDWPSPGELKRELKAQGFNVTKKSIRDWGLNKPFFPVGLVTF